ncbi:MAG: preprotein translocase subunit YajC [Betaproteobacteria bacterium]|nr:preprotein translocase subunit YajC [Betaproteobacteria bacterium]
MFVSHAFAQTAATPSFEQQLMGFLPIILMFVVLYFLMIRPQMKRNKEHRQMLEALKKGDEVITAGGLVAKVTKVGDGYVSIEVGRQGEQPIEMHVQKQAVTALLPVGTIKSI